MSITSPTAQGSSGQAFFMKTNSTAKIYANFTFPKLNNETWGVSPQILADLYIPGIFPSKNLTATADPNSITANKSNVVVTYTITAKDNIKGVYALFLYYCGLSPLVIGLNESDINAEIFNKFFTAGYMCPGASEFMPKMNIVGYSDMISKTISTDSSNTNNTSLVNQIGEIPSSPLKQFKAGVKLSDIKCRENFMLVTKHDDNSPACVTSNTAIVLAERGWTSSIHPNN